MAKRIDLTGQRFGHLEVLETAGKTRHNKQLWLCRCCACGKTHVSTGGPLKNGDTKSCGCLKKERITTLGRNSQRGTGIVFEARALLGLTQEEFALKLGCGVSSVKRAEAQGRTFSRFQIRRAFNHIVGHEVRLLTLSLRVPDKESGKGFKEKSAEMVRCANAGCLNAFPKQTNAIRRSRLHFCSRKCSDEARQHRVPLLCACGCGRVLRRKPSRALTGLATFCSTESHNAHKPQLIASALSPSIRLTPEQVVRLDSLRDWPDAPLTPQQIEWALNPPAEVAPDERRKPREKSRAARSIDVLRREAKRATTAPPQVLTGSANGN